MKITIHTEVEWSILINALCRAVEAACLMDNPPFSNWDAERLENAAKDMRNKVQDVLNKLP